MTDQDEIAEGPFEISFTSPSKTVSESGTVSWDYEGGLSGMPVLLEDGTLEIRVTPGVLEMVEDGGSVNVDVPNGAERVRLVSRDDPSFPDEE